MNIDPNGSSSPVGHNGFSVDSDPDSSGDTLANGSSIRGKAEIRATIGADSISPSEVGTRLKDTLMRLYPEEYASKQPIAFQSNVLHINFKFLFALCSFFKRSFSLTAKVNEQKTPFSNKLAVTGLLKVCKIFGDLIRCHYCFFFQ